MLLTVALLSGCNPQTLKYRLDPDFSALSEVARNVELVAVDVTDNRKRNSTSSEQSIQSESTDEAALLKKGLIDQLKELDFKIINNPLLADLAVIMEINQLGLNIDESIFKSTLKASSQLTLTIRKNGQEWSKIFRSSRDQEVANPVNNNDATGVINYLISKQLSAAFTDPALMEFLAKSSQD